MKRPHATTACNVPRLSGYSSTVAHTPAVPASKNSCRVCGQPVPEADGTICLACRLRPGLSTAGEIFSRFQAGHHPDEASDFAELCAAHPEFADDLRRLHEAAKATRAKHDTSVSSPLARQPPSIESASGTQPKPPREAPTPAALTRPAGGRYEIQGVVARGGMGVIYAVQDRDLNRQIAMKVIGTNLAGAEPISLEALPPAWVDRFVEEAQITAQLDHPNIVPVHEIGIDAQGRIYFTMKLVKGRALNEIFALARNNAEGWNLTRAVSVLLRACEAVAHAHERGVVHRDLKPQNVMVARLGEVYVMDWGLAKPAARADLHNLRPQVAPPSPVAPAPPAQPRPAGAVTTTDSPLVTMDGTLLGTPAYMSPEHAAGRTEDINSTSDVYSLGAILYELLAGHPPYLRPGEKKSPQAVLDAVRAGPPDPLRQIARDKPPELLAVCAKAMKRDAGGRYRNAGELSADLQAWLDGRVVRAHRTGALAELKAWILRNRLAAASQAAGVVLTVGVLLGVTVVQHRANRQLSRQAYAALVSQAAQELQAGGHAAAAALLDHARMEYRGWEWRHLRRWSRTWPTTTLCREPAGLEAVAIDPAQGWFVTAGLRQPLRLRSLADGRELASFGPTNVALLAAGHAGGFVAAATQAGAVALWALPAGKLRREWSAGTQVQSLAASRNEPILATGSSDGSIKVWGLESERPIAAVRCGSPITALAFAQDRVMFVGDERGAIYRWDAGGTGPPIEVGRQLGRVIALVPDHTGTQIVTSSPRTGQSTGLRVWNVAAGWSHDLPVPAGFADVWSAVFDASERHSLACSYYGSLLIADLNTGRLDAVIALDQRRAAGASFLGSETDVLTWAEDGEVVRLTRGETDHLQLAGPTGQLRTVLFADGGKRLRVATQHGEILEWNLATRELARRIPVEDAFIAALAQTRDGTLLVAGSSSGRLHLLEAAAGVVEWSSDPVGPDAEIWWLDLSPDDRQVVAGCSDGTLRLLDLKERRWLDTPIPALPRAVEGVCFSPDGATLGTCGNDGGVALWRTADWHLLWRREHVAATCRTIAFSPDGRRLVHGNSDGTVHLRSVKDGRLVLPPLAGHHGRVETVAYSPDGTRLFTGAQDGTVKVWDTETGTLLVTLPVTTRSPVWEVAVSPDGTRVAAADGEGTVTVWFGEPPSSRTPGPGASSRVHRDGVAAARVTLTDPRRGELP